jgi:hypothetical protein
MRQKDVGTGGTEVSVKQIRNIKKNANVINVKSSLYANYVVIVLDFFCVIAYMVAV